MFPSEVTKSVAVYHLPTTAGQKQPYPASADATITGALLPLDRKEQALEGGTYMVPYELYVGGSEDVRTGDKLVIDLDGTSTRFYVKSIFRANFGGLPHRRLSLSFEE